MYSNLRLFVFLVLLIPFNSFATSITISQPFTDTILCAGTAHNYTFTTSATFSSGNVFTMQISNAAGNFATAITIGVDTATTGGTINCFIPNLAAGIGYRIRIIASNPADTSADNGVDMHLYNLQGIFASGNSPICMGDSLHLTLSGLTAGVNLQWQGPNSFLSAQQNPHRANMQFADTGTYMALLGISFCADTAFAYVTVKGLPSLPTASANSPCEGDSLFLTATDTTSGVTYQWNGPNSFLSYQQNPIKGYAVIADSGNYFVSAIYNGCAAVTMLHVTIKQLPATPIANSNSPICKGDSLFILVTNADTGVLYIWSGPGSFSDTTTAFNIPNTQYSDSGKYAVYANKDGCISFTDTAYAIIKTVVVPSITLNSNPSPVIPGIPVIFTAIWGNGGSSPSFVWKNNGAVISGISTSTYTTVTSPGDRITVVLHSNATCAHPDSAVSNLVPVGINELANSNHVFQIYPNPSKGDIVIETVENNLIADGILRIYELSGRVIFEKDLRFTESKMPLHIDAVPGLYILEITDVTGMKNLQPFVLIK